MLFQECFKDAARKFPRRFKEVSRVFQDNSRVFRESLKGVSRKIQGNFQLVSRASKRRSKEISGKFQKRLKGVPMKFQGSSKKDFRVLQRSLRGVPRDIQW